MYVNPVLIGVVSTLLVELIIVIGIAIFNGNKKN
jgi:hypothetical protein